MTDKQLPYTCPWCAEVPQRGVQKNSVDAIASFSTFFVACSTTTCPVKPSVLVNGPVNGKRDPFYSDTATDAEAEALALSKWNSREGC